MATYRMTALGSLPGEDFNFGIHATGPSGSSAAAATAFAAALTALWTDPTDGLGVDYATSVSIVGCHVAELDALTGKQIDASDAVLSLAGTNAGQQLPNEVACAVSLRTALITRKGRGRFFLPPPAVTFLAGGRYTSAFTARVVAAAALMITHMQGAGYEPVIYHKDKTTTVINRVDVGDVPDSQRRRRDGLVEVRTSQGV